MVMPERYEGWITAVSQGVTTHRFGAPALQLCVPSPYATMS